MVSTYSNFISNIYSYLLQLFIYSYNISQYIIIYFSNIFSFNILFVKKSLIISKLKNIDHIHNIDNIYIDYDYIVYKKLLDNKVLVTFYNNINDIKRKDSIISCDFQFILVIIKVNNESYDITNILKNNKNYYYVINNYLFNDSFMNWLFINHLKKNLDEYNIVILDNTVTEIIINKTQYIKLNKTSYEILNKTSYEILNK